MKVASSSKNETEQIERNGQRLQWQKPEAKIAEVATATLAGHTHPNLADLQTCAS